MKDFQTTLFYINKLKSSSDGPRHWKSQRTSAIMLIFLTVWFLVEILRHTQSDYHTILHWASHPLVGMALSLFVGMVFYHSALGLQIIVEDYVSHSVWRTILVFKIKIWSLVMTVMAWFFIIHIAIMGKG